MSATGKSTFQQTLHLIGRLLQFVRPYKFSFRLALVLSVVLAVLAPIRPWLIKISVDKYIANDLWKGLLWISAVHFGVLLLETLIRFFFQFRIHWLGQTVVNDIRKAVYRKVIQRETAYFDRTPIGTLTTRTINDAETLNDVFSEGFISILADVLTIVAIISVMLWEDWRLTIISLLPLPLLLIATYFFKESIRKSYQKVRDAVARLNAFVQEHIVGMYIVQAFTAEKKVAREFKNINKNHRDANIKAIMAYSLFFPVVEIILALSIGLLVWYSAGSMLNDGVTAGKIIAFILYLNLLFRPLRMLADKFNVLQMGVVAAQRIFEVLDEETKEINSGKNFAANLNGHLVFDNIHFAYNPDTPVLKGISFDVPAGKMLAVVGKTGAGKTSIINLLNRQYEISAGKILLDGKDIRTYDLFALRAHIGIVLQDVFLFSGSVMDNITLQAKDINAARVVEICKMLEIHDFIMRLPGGYNFKVRERGGTLSQGQKQLLSFARVLLYNPTILVLDEATASVDSETEQLIQAAIEKITRGRTSIVIAHRLSTIRKAHEIIVLDSGKIIERGNHRQLVEKQGWYAEMQERKAALVD